MSFAKTYTEKKNRFEELLIRQIRELKDIPEPLSSAVKYSILSGGKRLRPILFIEALELFGGKLDEVSAKFACAVECIHTYSLIHDDLPCMDNDDLRRGRPTNHKVYGEAVAVLAGDALLNLAYELIFEGISLASSHTERYIRAGKLIADCAGGRGMVAGQALDVSIETDKTLLPSKLNYIYQHKTGDLISASLLSGAAIAGADDRELKIIREFGDNFGFSFQICDDILDYEENGKEDKETFVKIYGIANARNTLSESISMALEHLNFLDRDVSFLRKLAQKSIDRKI